MNDDDNAVRERLIVTGIMLVLITFLVVFDKTNPPITLSKAPTVTSSQGL